MHGMGKLGGWKTALTSPRRCRWWGRLHLRPSSLHVLLRWVRRNPAIGGYGGCRCWELTITLGNKVMMEAMEAHLWHQVYQHSFHEALRSALLLMGVFTNFCIMAHRMMLWVETIVYTHPAVSGHVHIYIHTYSNSGMWHWHLSRGAL